MGLSEPTFRRPDAASTRSGPGSGAARVVPATRPRTLAEKQPFLLSYAAGISIFSPSATAWQLCRVYSKAVPVSQLARMSMAIFPHQTALKLLQMNAATPVKEHLNPWAAFFVVGVLQGGVYGQCNVHFAKKLELSSTASLKGMFRGAGFAGFRDAMSQGMPFALSRATEEVVFDPLWRSAFGPDACAGDGGGGGGVKRAAAVMSTSVVATYLSQGLHNCQIKMQADQSLSYSQTIRALSAEHGASIMWKGGSARVGLLLIVNGLNEILIKPAWDPVPTAV